MAETAIKDLPVKITTEDGAITEIALLDDELEWVRFTPADG